MEFQLMSEKHEVVGVGRLCLYCAFEAGIITEEQFLKAYGCE